MMQKQNGQLLKKIQDYQSSIENSHPLLEDVWYTMDGLKLMLECSSNDDEQNFYSVWTCNHCIAQSQYYALMAPFLSVFTMLQAPFTIVMLQQLVKSMMSWRMDTIELEDDAMLIWHMHRTITCFLSNDANHCKI